MTAGVWRLDRASGHLVGPGLRPDDAPVRVRVGTEGDIAARWRRRGYVAQADALEAAAVELSR